MNRGRPGWLGMTTNIEGLREGLALLDGWDKGREIPAEMREAAAVAMAEKMGAFARSLLADLTEAKALTASRTADWKTALGQRDEWRTLAESCEVSPAAVARMRLTLVTALAGYREGNEDYDPEWPDDVESDNERAAYICNHAAEPWHCLRWLVANAGRLAADALEAEAGGES